MLHFDWIGTHFEAGLRYGRSQRERGFSLNRPEILGITPEKLAFGQACAALCQRVYPEFWQELRGIAQGEEMPLGELCAFLFGMYCFPGGQFCTCFAFAAPGGTVFGRNSDFAAALEPFYESSHYHLAGGNAFVGNGTAPAQMEDGVNCHGLAAGLTFVYPTGKKPGLNGGILTRYLLERCADVPSAIQALRRLPISSSQTITLADRAGRMAVVECNWERVEVLSPQAGEDFVAATNEFHSPAMLPYRADLEDTIHSGLRYQVARQALSHREGEPIKFAMDLLAGRFGFLCQYDRSLGMDTVWSSVYRLSAPGEVYRCEGNPSRQLFWQDKRLSF